MRWLAACALTCIRCAVITYAGAAKEEEDRSPRLTEKQVTEMLRWKNGNGDYIAVRARENAMNRSHQKQMYEDITEAVNKCDPSNKHVYTVKQVKVKLNNIRTKYQEYRARIDRSGEENVWAKTKQPFWWADAEALWGTREATMPSRVLEIGVRVKQEAGAPPEQGGGAPSAAATCAVAAAEPLGGAGVDEAADEAPTQPKTREEDAARRAKASELRARSKEEKRLKSVKDSAAVMAEAQRCATQDLLAGFAPLFAGVTEQLKRAVDMQGLMVQAALGKKDKKRKRRSESSARSSPSGSGSD